jgi:hypothetical protein
MSTVRRVVSKFVVPVVFCAALFMVFTILTPARARADVDMSDYNTYWQVATDPTPPDPGLDYNTYWAETQAKQQWQDQ